VCDVPGMFADGNYISGIADYGDEADSKSRSGWPTISLTHLTVRRTSFKPDTSRTSPYKNTISY